MIEITDADVTPDFELIIPLKTSDATVVGINSNTDTTVIRSLAGDELLYSVGGGDTFNTIGPDTNVPYNDYPTAMTSSFDLTVDPYAESFFPKE